MSTTVQLLERTHHSPQPLAKPRIGCPCELTPFHQVTTLPPGERTQVVHQFTTMQLVHFGKGGVLKSSLDLSQLHQDLHLHSLVLAGPGASNILLAKVSFDCLIKEANGNEVRDYLSFDLTIPGSFEKGIFSYDLFRTLYMPTDVSSFPTEADILKKAEQHLYQAIGHFYRLGNPDSHPHGHTPHYQRAASSDHQNIRHTEQLLVAYLGLKEAAQMLCNRLRTEIRAKYAGAQAAKVYTMGLHMDSTKLCCAPCEYALVGLMRDRIGLNQEGRRIGLLPNFQEEALSSNNQLPLELPRRNSFKLIVTVTASEGDSHHRTPPSYTVSKLPPQSPTPAYRIDVRNPACSTKVFTTLLRSSYDPRKHPTSTRLTDLTIGISGSESSQGSPKTMKKVKTLKELE